MEPDFLDPLAVLALVPAAAWAQARVAAAYGATRRRPARPFIAALLASLVVAAWSIAACSIAPASPGMALASAALGWTLVALVWIDVERKLLPDPLTLPLVAAGLLLALIAPLGDPRDHLIGAAAGYLVFAGLREAFYLIRRREGLGLGDAKLLAAAGAWLGWQALPGVVLIASAAGLVMALLSVATGRRDPRAAIPFGPFLAAGFWIVWSVGPLQFTQ